ncbi:MAG: ATPase, T2SS/T4P/T4SS family [Syntrophaceae bacterium]
MGIVLRLQKKKLGEMLVEAGLLTDEELRRLLVEHRNSNVRFGKIVVQKGIASEEQIIDLISRQLKIERYLPENYPKVEGLSSFFTSEIAQEYKAVPLLKKGRLLKCAMPDPLNIKILDTLAEMTKLEIEPVICTERELSSLIETTFGSQSSVSSGYMDALEELNIDASAEAEQTEKLADEIQVSSLKGMAEEAPIIRLVNSIIAQAVRARASDIHISPMGRSIQIRFRIDGKLQEVPVPPRSMFLPLISRIKIISNMDIALSRIPQDGRFTVKLENKEINVRVSSIPTIYGENLVLRLLDMSAGVYSLDRLGMSEVDREKIEIAIRKPYGMILSTGPTGSGKSTSLYSILKEINTPDINIITLEDPVEYRIESIRQVQLNRRAGMTFASGLRSILRQDPDVIMVGEIRDGETAGIGVQAALTGHRVFSTIHTNDASGAVTRLMDMGIEPFLVSTVLLVSFAQRLLRTICPSCKEEYRPSELLLKAWGLDKMENAVFKKGRGCPVCMGTGFKGRTGIFEVLVIDENVQGAILAGKSSSEITRVAQQDGKLTTLKENAINKVLQGATTLEEAFATVMS